MTRMSKTLFKESLKFHERKEYIEHYFSNRYKYDRIVLFLVIYHGVKMCSKALKRTLKGYGLMKQGSDDHVNDN